MLDHAPRLQPVDAERLASDAFGRPGIARELTSERDQNFEIVEATGSRFVLKVANALEERRTLEAQQCVLVHLARQGAPTPHVIPPLNGESVVEAPGPNGRRHLAWAVTHLPGVPLATLGHRSSELIEGLGAAVATLSRSLCDVDHPALHRDFHWDLANGRRKVAMSRPLLAQPLGGTVDVLLGAFDAHVEPVLSSLRRATIHNDLNDHNILVAPEAIGHAARVVGIVDFGDLVHSYAVADLAIAAAYAMLDACDPPAVLAQLVRGYSARHPLSDAELEALFGLACLRLCMSACIASEQQRARPDNEYLGVSQEAIQRTLPRLATIPYGLATAVVRAAANLEPVPSSARVRAWLRSQTASFAPVLDIDVRQEACVVLDLSVASPLVSGDERQNEEPALTPRIARVMADAEMRVAVGRYDEPRLLYTAPFFATGADPAAERRTIHIGLDLFANAGTPVHAPLDGIVHAFADNAAPQDYGPVIILRHATEDDDQFFTLYGHLSRESLDGLAIGQRVSRGHQFASLGAPAVNGGWTPHLHLQIITDLLDFGCDFPGVAAPSQRDAWRSLSPDPNLLIGVPAERFPPLSPGTADTLTERRRRLGGNLSVAYREPIKMARGWMQYLYDGEGLRFLDAYNNVPHVGHSHPRVVRAGQQQMGVLNTNTRYLGDLLNEYAARLTATFPEPLRSGVAFFVSSASEANELALRLARAHTGAKDTIVLAGAYHGNTTTLIEISPYKHAGPGGSGAPDWVHVAPLPDDYRGEFKRGDPDAGRKYAEQVGMIVDQLRADRRRIAAFIAETCPSVGGQIIFPRGYLADVYRHVRAANGVCIADEVQTGLGRIGTHFWAFEAQGVVPDIVVMGKPLGNGHPLAAVVTTRTIAESFNNSMEFFSTFGGNNVSCAVGLAVLDVVRDEGLQAHASRVGQRMLAALRPLVGRHALVGDVRGSGLFLGVELVRDRDTLEPAGTEASYVVERMREERILLGTDGPYHNVVKIRPPMPFDDSDAGRLVHVFDRILAEELSR